MKVLITGAGGILGRAARSQLAGLEISVVAFAHEELDVTDQAQIRDALAQYRPDVVLNCAAYTRVDDAETNEADAFAVNAEAARVIADHCASNGIRVVYPSTDYVFDGGGATPIQPARTPRPINTYGRSKAAGENATRAAGDHLIVRTSWLFGGGGANFVRSIAKRLQEGDELRVVADQVGRPTYAKDFALAIGKLLVQRVPAGIYHVANSGTATWFEFAGEIARQTGSKTPVTACTTADYPRPARRPTYSVLDTGLTDGLIGPLRDWREALADAIRSADF